VGREPRKRESGFRGGCLLNRRRKHKKGGLRGERGFLLSKGSRTPEGSTKKRRKNAHVQTSIGLVRRRSKLSTKGKSPRRKG